MVTKINNMKKLLLLACSLFSFITTARELDFGLSYLLKENKPPFFSDVEYENGKRIQLKNRTIQLSLSYKF